MESNKFILIVISISQVNLLRLMSHVDNIIPCND